MKFRNTTFQDFSVLFLNVEVGVYIVQLHMLIFSRLVIYLYEFIYL